MELLCPFSRSGSSNSLAFSFPINYRRACGRGGVSETTREHLDNFWELLDELLNAVLFVLIGLDVLVLSFQHTYLLAGLVARWLSVLLQIKLFSLVREFSARTITILTWGGLRGGISVALALTAVGSRSRISGRP